MMHFFFRWQSQLWLLLFQLLMSSIKCYEANYQFHHLLDFQTCASPRSLYSLYVFWMEQGNDGIYFSLFFSLSHVWHRKMHFDVHKKRAFLTVSHVDISSIRLENANFGHKHTIPVFFHFIQPLVVGKKRAPALQFKLWIFFLMILMVNSKTCLMALKPYFFPSIFHTSAILSARL